MIISVRTISKQRMVLEFRSVSAWGNRIFGLLFIACGAMAVLFLATSVSFRCTRLDGLCHFERSTPLGHSEGLTLISDLRGGTVEERSNGLFSSMVLVAMSRTGDLAIPLAGATVATKDSLALELTSFTTAPQTFDFDIQEDGRLSGHVVGALLLSAGLLCLLAIERVRLTLDRRSGMLQLRTRRFFRSRGTRVRVVRVKDVKTREHRFRNAASWSVTMVLDDGEEIPLTRLPLFTAISAEQSQHLIRRWLA